MARSINRARPERDIIARSRYGRYDTRRQYRATLRAGIGGWAPKRPEQIPIRIVAPHPSAHHPASPTDIRAILARLPGLLLNHLAEIHLCRGADEDLTPPPGTVEEHYVVDPWIGRRNYERVPGIYSSQIRGPYV